MFSWHDISRAMQASREAEQRVGMMRSSIGLVRAAKPSFPYPHRTVAQVSANAS